MLKGLDWQKDHTFKNNDKECSYMDQELDLT